ncbi:MAG: carboxypeptidase regulatory-like domain-containing protein [Acidobacteria bacterium]|nr:carboxypeptidase regulatory-like domain-containing protein [Acidobacteriota bacterium]
MHRALFGLLVVLAAPTGARGQAPARDTPAPAKGTASIRGRVVEAVSGRPLSRVEIRASGPGAQPASGLTDGEGRYDLNDLPAGAYTVTATKANYVRAAWGEQRPEGPGKRITLADGQKLDNINITLTRAGVVTGKIVDEFGDPVTDVFVSAMRYAYVQGSRRLMPSGRSGPTNDIGEFRLYGLSPGQYYISATLRNLGVLTDTSDRVGYAPTFYPGTGNVAEAQRLTIAPGQTVTGINLTLLPIQTAKVSGTVLDAEGKPVLAAMVAVMPPSVAMPIPSVMSPVRPDGKFTLNGMTPGDYTLRVTGANGETAYADVSVSRGDVNDVQLVVAKPSTIRGRVVFTPAAADAPKPPPIQVIAVRPDRLLGGGGPGRVKDDGTFEMTAPAGRTLIVAAPVTPAATASTSPSGPAWRLSRVIVNDVDVSDTGLDVAPSATVDNVVIEMMHLTNEASGRVTDGDGNLVRDCFVIVFAQDPARWTAQSRYAGVARPGIDDRFRIRLLPGDYYAVAMSDVEQGAWTDSEFLSLARDRATKFSIADGEKKTIDLPLSPAPVF